MLASLFAEFDRERRRIEEALHDGVQQDLAATAVTLQLARQLLEHDPKGAGELLEELETQIEASLERVRVLAAEIYPATLAAHGLGSGVGRHSLEVEEAVYFACRGLGGDARLWEEAGELRFEVRGEFDAGAVEHARARIEAVGGQLAVSAGVVAGSVPASPSAR
jgi:signal transduction histidine kinase